MLGKAGCMLSFSTNANTFAGFAAESPQGISSQKNLYVFAVSLTGEESFAT